MPDELSLYAAMLDDPAGGQLGRLLEGMMTAQVTAAVARLGVADELARARWPPPSWPSGMGPRPVRWPRLLAAAAAYGLVSRRGDGRYALTPAGALLRSSTPGSARSLAVGFLGPPIWASAGRLADIVRNPEPVNPAAPGGVYAYYGEHPDEGAWFARAMGRTTAILVSELARTGFRPLTAGRIVDVGGSRGTLLAHLLQVLPDADGVLLDRAEALAEAPGYLAAAGVAGRAGTRHRGLPPRGAPGRPARAQPGAAQLGR